MIPARAANWMAVIPVSRQVLRDGLGWGVALWLIGYVLGIVLFPVVPTSAIGWVIMPVGIAVTLWVLLRKVRADSFRYLLALSVAWTLIAIAFDYVFLVRLFEPADGYYKLDVYLYYALTFALPLAVGWRKNARGVPEHSSRATLSR